MARPTFQVTDKLREQVKMMTAGGCRQEDVARVLDITTKTLRKHFRQELDKGAIEANVAVATTMYRMATTGTNTSATIFWLKVRNGWRENAPLEETRKSKASKTEDLPEAPGLFITGAEQSKREPLA
jgi:predicted transcriptional regulator